MTAAADAPQRSVMDRKRTPPIEKVRRSGQLGALGQIQPARLGGAAREAGARQRPRRRRGQPARQLRALRRAALRRLGRPEDLLLGAAREQRLELLALDRLAGEQELRDALELRLLVDQDVARLLMGGLDDPADLVV